MSVNMDYTISSNCLSFFHRFSHSAARVRCASLSLGNWKKQPVCSPLFSKQNNIVSSKTDIVDHQRIRCHYSTNEEEEEEEFHTLLDFNSHFFHDSPWLIELEKKIRLEMSDWRKSLKKAWECYKRSSGDTTSCSRSSFGLILWLREINDEVRKYNYKFLFFYTPWLMLSGLRWEKELGRLDEKKCNFENFSRSKDKPLLQWLIGHASLDYSQHLNFILFSRSGIPSEWYDFGRELDIKEFEWRRSLVKAWESKCSSGGDHSKWVETSEALKLQLQEINNMVLEHNLFVPSNWQRRIRLVSWERELAKAQKQEPYEHWDYANDQASIKVLERRRSLMKAWESKCSGDHSKWVESSEALKLQLQFWRDGLDLPFFDWKRNGIYWEYELSFVQYQLLNNMERERLKLSEDALHNREKICLDLYEEIKSNISKWRIYLKKAFASKCEGDRSKWFINSLALQFQLEEINTKVFLYNLFVSSDQKIFLRYDRRMCGLDWEEELEKEIKNIII